MQELTRWAAAEDEEKEDEEELDVSAMSLLEVEQLLARAGKRGQRLAALQVLAVMVETLHHSVLLRKITQVSLEALSQVQIFTVSQMFCYHSSKWSKNVLQSGSSGYVIYNLNRMLSIGFTPLFSKKGNNLLRLYISLHLPFNAITPEMPSNVVQIICFST